MNAPDAVEYFLIEIREATPKESHISADQWYRYWKLRYQERFPASSTQDYDRFISGLTDLLGL